MADAECALGRRVAPCPCPLCGAPDATGHFSEPNRDYWQCSSCALVFLSPAQRLAFADEVARYRLHRNSEHDPAYLEFLSRLAQPMMERVPPGVSGLDYGCGPAPALALLFSRSGRPPTHVCFYHERTMRWIADHFGWRLMLPATNVAIFTIGARSGIR